MSYWLLGLSHVSRFKRMDMGFPAHLTACSPKSGPLREEPLWCIPLLIISCWVAQAFCPWHARQHEIHLKTPALPRKLWCLIWHHKFLSGARHWMLMLGTAEYQTFMNRSLRSFQLWGAQKIGSCVITALSVCERSQRKLNCSTQVWIF